MGGTSTDVSLVDKGRAAVSTEARIGGLPNLLPALQIETVGAGGGSIAFVDEGGMLQVGPQSAGANPGPACYARGGNRPTLTDAWCAIGVLRPSAFFGGRLRLRRDLALSALQGLARQLGITPLEAAWEVLRVASAKTSQTVHLVSVERGHDPRDFALVAYGGAGPLHAALNAEELGIKRVLVPPSPGAFSAYGLLCADYQRDFVRSRIEPMAPASVPRVQAILQELAATALNEFKQMNLPSMPLLEYFLDVRYVGQAYEVRIPIGNQTETINLDEARHRFDAEHQGRYGFSEPKSPAEIVHYRVTATVPRDTPLLHDAEDADIDVTTEEVFVGRPLSFRFVARAACRIGKKEQGPLVIEELTATTFVPQGWVAERDATGNLWLTHEPPA
jgi:N-methylhydantoinase A